MLIVSLLLTAPNWKLPKRLLAVKMFIKYSEDKVHKLWIQYILDGSESGFFKKERMNLFKKIYLIDLFDEVEEISNDL